jgi:hypothetical protein
MGVGSDLVAVARARLSHPAVAAAVRSLEAFIVDDGWALVGSGSWDPRSLRLNFGKQCEQHGNSEGMASVKRVAPLRSLRSTARQLLSFLSAKAKYRLPC